MSGWQATLSTRAGFDSNPLGLRNQGNPNGAKKEDREFVVAGLALARDWASAGRKWSLAYQAERMDLGHEPGEDCTNHSLALRGSLAVRDWQASLDASGLWVDGSSSTRESDSQASAHANALWRDRRAQRQARARWSLERVGRAASVRWDGALLDYDYHTLAVPGKSPCADRSDLWTGLEAGGQSGKLKGWRLGARIGRQHQATVPLPGGEFEYSSRSLRIYSGWEGKLGRAIVGQLRFGPDWRHFNGAVDERIMHGRERASGWLEASGTVRFSPRWTLATRATRGTWVSASGKSAYLDTVAEASLTCAVNGRTSARGSARIHRSRYFPLARDDWESQVGLGVTRKAGDRWQWMADALYQRGWNGLAAVAGREFSRCVVQAGLACRL